MKAILLGAALAFTGDAVIDDEHAAPAANSESASSAAMHAAAAAQSDPIVDWPEEEVRKIIAFRLVSGAGERFSGRAVRLALAAEGFLLGKFGHCR